MTQRHIPLTIYLYYALPVAITGFAYGWEVGSMGGILAMPRELQALFREPT